MSIPKTYSLAEVAEALCGDSMGDPQRWVTRQIRAGRFTARRVGRHWRMTQDDLDAALAAIANPAAAPAPAKPAEPVSHLTPADKISTAAMRRRRMIGVPA